MGKGNREIWVHFNQLNAAILLIIILLSEIASSDQNNNLGGNARNSIPPPDQIAMPAEHRAGFPGAPYGHPLPPPGHGHIPPIHPPGAFPPHQTSGADIDWPLQAQHDTPQIKILQVQCEKSHMRVNIEFDRPFYGLIFSKGHYSDPHCVHLAPGSGHLSATFDIFLDSCGMSSSANANGVYGPPGPTPSGTFVENTIIVQFDPLVQEIWDQARKLRCTWYDFYEKSVTFRPFQVDMLHAVTANFLGDNLQCWMQIQVGKGPWASEVSGIVKIGQTMTMVLAIKDDENKFDMLVRNCVAHDGKRAPIQLVDQYGCVTRPKIMSRFHKVKNFGPSASVVSYAYFQAFKFPDSMNVHFQCVIQVCRFQCPEPKCGKNDHYGLPGPLDPRTLQGSYSEKKEKVIKPPTKDQQHHNSAEMPKQVIGNQHQRQPPPILQQHHQHPHPNHRPSNLPPIPPQHLHGFANKPQGIPRPLQMPAQPSNVMLPPLPPQAGYSNVKREGVVIDDQGRISEDDEDEDQEPTFAALGGRPRSVDFQRQRQTRSIDDEDDHQFFTVNFSHDITKRAVQEMTNVETSRVIQVVAPGDVAFSLGNGSANTTTESIVMESRRIREIDGICMSISSFVGGLVMLLLLLIVSSLVAAFLFVRVRSIHRKTSIFSSEYLKTVSN